MKPVIIEGGRLALIGPYVVELPEGTTAVEIPDVATLLKKSDSLPDDAMCYCGQTVAEHKDPVTGAWRFRHIFKPMQKTADFAPEEVNDKPGGLDAPVGQHWGYHLIMDMSDCAGPMDDDEAVRQFIGEMVKTLDMKVLMPLQLIHVHGKDGRGVTAVQTITTSSITFHGDDERHCIYLDVFSCAPYDPRVAFDLAMRWFQPKHVGYRWLYRDAGEYPEKSQRGLTSS